MQETAGLIPCSEAYTPNQPCWYVMDSWDPWGTWPPQTIWLMLAFAFAARYAALWFGLRGWRDWFFVWVAFAGLGAYAYHTRRVGGVYGFLAGLIGCLICAAFWLRSKIEPHDAQQAAAKTNPPAADGRPTNARRP